jgi:predicted phosphodiesterase
MNTTHSREKLAIISDIHGNLPALEAVVADSKRRGVGRFLLLGDYITDFPFPNEVAECLRNLDNAVIIRGNKEERFGRLRAEPEILQREQMAAANWNMRELTEENKDFLFGLPDTAEFSFGGETLRATHSVREFNYELSRLPLMGSSRYREAQLREPFPRSEYAAKLTAIIDASPEVSAKIEVLPRGIYTFGHNHLQAHYWRGDKLFVNPGACGLPLDFEPNAPYTVITTKDGIVSVEEFRVKYDISQVIAVTKASSMYDAARVWCDIHAKVLETGRDYIGPFLQHCYTIAREREERDSVVSDEVWHKAWATWDYTSEKY